MDPEDYVELAKHKWFAKRCDRRFYAVRSGKNKNVKMHHVIMGTEEGKVIDHINGNGLDNRKANVRFATVQQNGWNKRKQSGNYSSKYKGVNWEKKRR
ncbi:MAG: HNH endonuclease, partial [Desulfobacteraceae bacterium]|nr:HNH endonuclease [Desulfobacteraceae bacterium]